MGHVGKLECLRGVDFVVGDVLRGTWGTLKRKPWREREDKVFKRREIEERKECLGSSKCFNGVIHARPKRRRVGKKFPPERSIWRHFGDHFPLKSPTRRCFGDQVSHLGKTLDRPIFSFFFSFLFVNNLNINKWVGSFKTNSPFAYFNFINKKDLVGQLVSRFQWANGFRLFCNS